MIKYVPIEIVSMRLGITKRRVQQMCKDGTLSGARKVNGEWEVPVTADARLGLNEPRQQLIEASGCDEVSPEKLNEALRKLGTLKEYDRFIAEYERNGGNRSQGTELFASQQGIDRATIYRWQAKLRSQGLKGLIDTRGRRASDYQRISPAAFEMFKKLYLDQRRHSIRTCYDAVVVENRKNQHGWIVPSYEMMCKYVKKHIPYPVLVLNREGLSEYKQKCAPYTLIDPDSIEPGQIWAGDHHRFNCYIRHRNGWVRPWITVWQDMRSRMIVGWHISVSPNQTTILRAMKRAVKKYGPPDTVKIDNGKDFDSEMWMGETKAAHKKRKFLNAGDYDEKKVAGIYAMLDIEVSFSRPYHPQSKRIERFFDTMDGKFIKTMRTYCGKDAKRKPDDLTDYIKTSKAIAEADDLESFAEKAGKYIENIFNNTAHDGRGMDGRSPAEGMAARTSRRVPLDASLDLVLRLWSGVRIVGRNGVMFNKMWYGQYNMELTCHQGRKVRVSCDPDDIRSVYVYDADTYKLITLAKQALLRQYSGPIGVETARDAAKHQAQAKKRNKYYVDSRRVANMDVSNAILSAQQKACKNVPKNTKVRPIRVVGGPMDGQAAEHQRIENQQKLKKAAGAENITLDINIEELRPKESEHEDLRLFEGLWDD